MPKNSFYTIGRNQTVLVFGLVLVIFIGLLGLYLFNLNRALTVERKKDLQEAESYQKNNVEQVRRVLLKRVRNGEIEYIEILSNGDMHVYDEKMNKRITRHLGIGRTRSIFLDIEESLAGNRILNGWDGYQIIIDTNKGRTVIDGGGSGTGGNGQWDDVIEEIETTKDTVTAPTPTLLPTRTPTPTPLPGSTPLPVTLTPTGIQPSPTTMMGIPTPLPDYRTAPPFTCEEYAHLGRPVTISNVICGAD